MTHVVRLEQVTVKRQNNLLIDQIDWTVDRDQNWAIVGRNGAGKTTLLKLLTGYIWPSKGSVTVLGETLGKVELSELRKKIGWISAALLSELEQSSASSNVLDVVCSGYFASFGLWKEVPTHIRIQAFDLLEQMGISSLAQRNFSVLSQGQKQSVMLARAWLSNPELLILDEPCAGLDVPAREALLQSLSAISQQKDAPTMLYVTHHIEEILPSFQYIALLDQGKLVAQGLLAEILTGATLSKLWHLSVDVLWRENRPFLIPVPTGQKI
ncbi:ABC transporter ATP-binding protein [Alicyclobacillus tolerans]|uniref:Iron complex transport system ATP-binding protein n=1 Tax=Alicyclobacillus tolerans TaxID=90970 RepID=A0ABT9LV81_9BACL|nr:MULTISPECIES: ABC transporter ATP-binding protein [Alicyclobacillus]MDP9728180.1 iron complex transport system ATP-binding protein [Alicyclobacillus tengchongensis]QRF23403.1 ABC transporter ATP-binding protein [Alicyclobacillus sp. TC]